MAPLVMLEQLLEETGMPKETKQTGQKEEGQNTATAEERECEYKIIMHCVCALVKCIHKFCCKSLSSLCGPQRDVCPDIFELQEINIWQAFRPTECSPLSVCAGILSFIGY